MSDRLRRDVAGALRELRERAPLVHCIVSTVSMSLVADGLLATGARPMMTETPEEAPSLAPVADALLVNLGTLSRDGAEGIPATVAAARAAGVPWVLDPTAVGHAPVRTPLARELLGEGPAVVRGNASEILVLAGGAAGGRGADSTATPEEALGAAQALAARHSCVVAVSGDVDVVTDGERVVRLANGTPMLTRVTGTGCLLGGLAAALTRGSPFVAVVAATTLLGVAAEVAAEHAPGPGTFRVALLDALDAVTPDMAAERMRSA